MELTQEMIKAVKGRGFLRNRGRDTFSARILGGNGVFDAKNLAAIGAIADKYGEGKVSVTVRMCLEIPGIKYEDIDAVEAAVEELGLWVGGTGAKVRPVVSCKGTVCVFGRYDTQALAKQIHEQFYLPWHNITLPHKFKIAVGGCPNNCAKPSLNDFAVIGNQRANEAKGEEENYMVYVGGRWGRDYRHGTPLSKPVTKEEVLPMIEKALLIFLKYGEKGKRFSYLVEEMGIEKFEELLRSDDILAEKEELIKKYA